MNLKEIKFKITGRWFLLFIILICILQIIYCSDLSASERTSIKDKYFSNPTYNLKQVGAFKVKENAERFAEKLKEEGLKVEIHKGFTVGNEPIYRVFAGQKECPSSEDMKQVGAFKVKENAERYVRELTNKGHVVEICKGKFDNNKVIYRVFASELRGPTGKLLYSEKTQKEKFVSKDEEKEALVSVVETLEKEGDGSEVSAARSMKLATFKVFREMEMAENFAKDLKNKGYQVETYKTQTKDNRAIYTVFAKKPDELKEEKQPVEVGQQETLEREKLVEKKLLKRQEKTKRQKEISKKTLSSKVIEHIASFKIFDSKKDAEEYVKELKNKGYNVYLHIENSKDGKMIYTVFSKRQSKESRITNVIPEKQKRETIKTIIPKDLIVQKPLQKEKRKPTETTQIKTESKQTISLDEKSSLESQTTKDERITADIFGRRHGYLHPFLSITGYYTDNVFNTPEDKKDDFVTVISPGLWLTVPHISERLASINTSNISPGGFKLSHSPENFYRRYQAYLFYGADIELFSKYDSENVVNHTIEGLLQYNFRGGLTVEFVDQFLFSHDIRGTGISTELDKYYTNLSNLILMYDTGRKLRFRVDYANFLVNYKDPRNDFRHRTDNMISTYVFYKVRPKTSLFLEHNYVDIEYDRDILSDSEEHHYFGGIQWDITAKSKGSIRAGYGNKQFDVQGIDGSNDFILEAQINHEFTPKTSVMLNAFRKTNETNISTTNYILTNGIELMYLQRLSGKITGNIRLSYIHDHYKDDLTFGGETKERKDRYYLGGLNLEYKFRDWLNTALGYIFTRRDSNFSDFDYTSNIVFFNITGSL